MRLPKVVILVNLALGLGLLAGSLWWEREADRLRRELDAARQSSPSSPGGMTSWTVMGIVRAVLQKDGVVVLTHEPIPGLMGSMTMGFRLTDRGLMKGIAPGDRVEFTLLAVEKDLVLVALRKEGSP
jgi:Cu/Ag efflux protein CusF